MQRLIAIAALLFSTAAHATLNSTADTQPNLSPDTLALRSEGVIILISKKSGPCPDGDHLAGYADSEGKHVVGCWFEHGDFVFVQWRDGDMSRLPKNKFEPYNP